MKYRILKSDNSKDLEEALNRYFESGWILSGTLHVINMAGILVYIQSIIKE